ncbi:MAG TPA: dephospho-CoA kinase [Bryobacteraceae bacterium]|nr:dephospho-CoA kinase [Bryobacteraceae bacterium]
MLRVGLTGGFACGKSFVGRTLEALGCFLLRADDIGHEVLKPGGAAYDAVVHEFGAEILDDDATINRRRLAAIAFTDPEKLARLNNLVHPAVIALEEQRIAEAARSKPDGIAVLEAAILIETGSHKRFQKLIVVVCTEEQQIARAMHRDGLTEEEARARLRRQMPLTEKRRFADYIIDTSGPKENTVEQTRAVYESLRSLQRCA